MKHKCSLLFLAFLACMSANLMHAQTIKFYATGDSAFIMDAGYPSNKTWQPDAIPSTNDTLVLNLLAGKDYSMKVTLHGTWDENLGYNDLTSPFSEGISTDMDENIHFTLATAGAVRIICTEDVFAIEGNFVLPAKFYVTGDTAFVVDAGLTPNNAWQPDAIPSTNDTLVLNLLAGKDYSMKVTLHGTWDETLGYYDLTLPVSEGISTDIDYNIHFTLATAGIVRIIYTDDVFAVEGNFVVTEVIPAKFYVTGNEEFVVDAGLPADSTWRYRAIKSETDTCTLNLFSGRHYVMKVVPPDATYEDHWPGYEELTDTTAGLIPERSGSLDTASFDIGFELVQDGEVRIIYTESVFKVEGNFVEQFIPAKFYVTGNEDLIVDAGFPAERAWQADAIKSESDTIVLNLLSGKDYQLKITLDGTWDYNLGYNDLTEVTPGLSDCYEEHNIGFALQYPGEVRIIYTVDIFKVEGSFVLPLNYESGLFSISAATRVRFSQGNLQYQATSQTWRFAEREYDYIGDLNSETSDTYSGWIDLFGWGTGTNPTQTSINDSDYPSFVDWGINPISNGGNIANKWRTLTESEWNYVLYQRPNAGNLRGLATVNNVPGLVILPDSWVGLDNVSFVANIDDWYTNNYAFAQWNRMDSLGAVFLPAAGFRNYNGYIQEGITGTYWSSTSYGGGVASYMHFRILDLYVGDYDGARYVGQSVRLVKDENEGFVFLNETIFDRRPEPRKVFRDGQLYIEMPDGTRYSPEGHLLE